MAHRILLASALGVLLAAPFAGNAQAAVSVFGPGPAKLCYDGAEAGNNANDYLADCDQALAGVLSDHDRAATFINRGVIRLSLSQPAAALEDFNLGLSVDGSLAEGYVDRGACLIDLKRYADAVKDIDKGLSMGATRTYIAYYDRAIANEALGDVTGAYNDYQQALAAKPDFTAASDELKRFKVVRKPATGA
jgi:tetratricopeptide (TPR) repeat protein